ncbi:hypothetical protein ABBQ38_005204 [Trebouxia sp. C0009 RCD-2024]
MQKATPGICRPHVSHALSQTVKKGEDITIVHESPHEKKPGLGYNLAVLAVADGHNGSAAALHCQAKLYSELMQHMPTKPPPDASSTQATKAYAEKLREAVATTFLALEGQFVLTGQLSGCTLTVVIITDWLLTVAAVGDSKAVLDTGGQFLEVSPEHRVHHHLAEQDRLRKAGSYLAPISVYMDGAAEPGEPGYGPLRAWPGGLCVSRAIGDMDVGECILAHPHIMQIQIPPEGARLVMASDGLWDCFPTRKVVKMARTKETQPAVDHIARAAIRHQGGQISDDLTIIVVDLLPSCTTFPEVASSLSHSPSSGSLGSARRPSRPKSSSSLKSFFRCGSEPSVLEEFEPSFHDPSVRDPSQRGRGHHSNHANVNILADVDSYVEFAHLSPVSVARRQQQQQQPAALPEQQQPAYVSPFAQPNLARDSSDSASSSVYFRSKADGEAQQSLRHIDYTTHAGSQVPTTPAGGAQVPPGHRNMQSLFKDNSGLLRVGSRGSIKDEVTPSHGPGSRQSIVHHVPVLGTRGSRGDAKRKSINDKLLNRSSMGSRQGSVHLERLSATHYGGGQIPIGRLGSGSPEGMTVHPILLTSCDGGFKKYRSGQMSGELDMVRR